MNVDKNHKPVKKLSIILADDDIDDCLFFTEALEELKINIQLKIVHDGEELMRQLALKNNKYDVLFLDLNMPRKNGFECLQEIKSNEKLISLPVINLYIL